LARLFGFVQFDLPGTLAIADGRYLARDDGDPSLERVLVVETLAAPAPPSRRRRRPRPAAPGGLLAQLPLARVTAVRAFEPFAQERDATEWLDQAVRKGSIEALIAEGIDLLNRALHAHMTASADPSGQELRPERAVAVRIGYGSGEEVAAGNFLAAREVDVWTNRASRRRQRSESLRPQERVAAVLLGREKIDACETLLLRARADLDAGRRREAALQLRIGVEALLAELPGAVTDPRHDEDMRALTARRGEIREAAQLALRGDLEPDAERSVRDLLELCERVLRRRRILRGSNS
jgi:hypothetical protein